MRRGSIYDKDQGEQLNIQGISFCGDGNNRRPFLSKGVQGMHMMMMRTMMEGEKQEEDDCL
jgi:hypothetical protein